MFLTAYSAYGLRIHTEMVFPELRLHPQQQGTPDVTISLLPAVDGISATLANGYYEVRPNAFRMDIPGVGIYLVEEGKRITFAPVAGADLNLARLYLLGPAVSALLYQRGFFLLHGSAVETRWGTMVFLGNTGAGKSTLAAQFHRRGYRVLSDDISAITATGDGLCVHPALAQFRLCADAYERMGRPDAHFDVDKFLIRVTDGYCSHPVPLRALHLLSEEAGPEPQFTAVRGFERVTRLMENVFRPGFLKGQSTERELVRLGGKIAMSTPMFQVARRKDPDILEKMVDFLESQWTHAFDETFIEEEKPDGQLQPAN